MRYLYALYFPPINIPHFKLRMYIYVGGGQSAFLGKSLLIPLSTHLEDLCLMLPLEKSLYWVICFGYHFQTRFPQGLLIRRYPCNCPTEKISWTGSFYYPNFTINFSLIFAFQLVERPPLRFWSLRALEIILTPQTMTQLFTPVLLASPIDLTK